MTKTKDLQDQDLHQDQDFQNSVSRRLDTKTQVRELQVCIKLVNQPSLSYDFPIT